MKKILKNNIKQKVRCKIQKAKSKLQYPNSKEQRTNFAICCLPFKFIRCLPFKFIYPFLFIGICFLQFAFCPFINAQTLQLQNAIDLSLQNYPSIQQASLQTQQQQALTNTATRYEPLNVNSSFGQINSKVFDYNVGVAQGFKLPNAYKAEKNLLNQNVNMATSYEAITKNELIKNVSISYYNWLYNWQQYKLLMQTDSIFADYEKVATKKFQVGESNKLEQINSTLQRNELKQQLALAKTQVEFYLVELQKWTGNKSIFLPPSSIQNLTEINLLDSAIVTQHPVLYSLQQQIKAKELAIQIEKTKALPVINVGLNSQSLDKGQPYFYGSLGVNIPISKKSIKAHIQSASIEKNIATMELEKSTQELLTIFLQQYQLQQQFKQQVNYYQTEALPMAESIIYTAQRSYNAGDIGYIEYLQNVKDAIKIKMDNLSAINNYNQTIINIQYLINK